MKGLLRSCFQLFFIVIILFGGCTSFKLMRIPSLKSVYDTTGERKIETVRIGNQMWAIKNLDVDRYQNGDTIPCIRNSKEWKKTKTGAYSYFWNNDLNDPTLGKLYNWYAVNDPRGIAPPGWRVPSESDWRELIKTVGKKNAKSSLKDPIFDTILTSPKKHVTNQSGFSAVPSGVRYSNSSFSELIYIAYWASNERVSYGRNKSKAFCIFQPKLGDVFSKAFNKNTGLSIRLICESDSCESLTYQVCYTEDQKNYGRMDSVRIGNQFWSVNNLEVERYRNGDKIPFIRYPKELKNAKTGAWCYYIKVVGKGYQVSKCYNWYAVNDPRGLAPEGWHVPSDSEWTEAANYLNREKILNEKNQNSLHHTTSGSKPDMEAKFVVLPYGRRNNSTGFLEGYRGVGKNAFFWSATPASASDAMGCKIKCKSSKVKPTIKYHKNKWFSVRCVADEK